MARISLSLAELGHCHQAVGFIPICLVLPHLLGRLECLCGLIPTDAFLPRIFVCLRNFGLVILGLGRVITKLLLMLWCQAGELDLGHAQSAVWRHVFNVQTVRIGA